MITMDYKLAMAAGRDAANRQMRKAGRTAWNEDDWNTAASLVQRLLDGVEAPAACQPHG
jgi:hypothetical protein